MIYFLSPLSLTLTLTLTFSLSHTHPIHPHNHPTPNPQPPFTHRMSQSQLYGIDREIAQKLESKYDLSREREAQEWMERVLGKPLFSRGSTGDDNNNTSDNTTNASASSSAGVDFHEQLKDGLILAE